MNDSISLTPPKLISSAPLLHLFGLLFSFGILFLGHQCCLVPLDAEDAELCGQQEQLELLVNGADNLQLEHDRLANELGQIRERIQVSACQISDQLPIDQFLEVITTQQATTNTQLLSVVSLNEGQGVLSSYQLVRVQVAGDFASVCRLLQTLHQQQPFAWPTAIELRGGGSARSKPANALQSIEITYRIPYLLHDEIAAMLGSRSRKTADANNTKTRS